MQIQGEELIMTHKDKFYSLFEQEWYEALKPVLESDYWKYIGQTIARERQLYTIYPDKGSDLLFKAFRTTPLSKVKVVILGQDPYHDGSYDGFAFSNRDDGQRISPSLRNILTEVESDVYDGLQLDQNPSLERWAQQGVLLINTAHTVRKGSPGSHLEYWEVFTKQVLLLLSQQNRPMVWILWGKKASNAALAVEKNKKHLYLGSAHPSPYSAHSGFFGSKPFSRTNEYLKNNEYTTITW
jgi:uracil-DNA glycosylase